MHGQQPCLTFDAEVLPQALHARGVVQHVVDDVHMGTGNDLLLPCQRAPAAQVAEDGARGDVSVAALATMTANTAAP